MKATTRISCNKKKPLVAEFDIIADIAKEKADIVNHANVQVQKSYMNS